MTRPLACASCGGPLPEEAAHRSCVCPFCGVANVPPPAVVEKTVERLVFVPAPGADPGALGCPRCGTKMTNAVSGQVVVHGCPDCGGVWLDPRAVDHARNVKDEDLSRVAFSIVGPVVRARPDREILVTCPVCSGATRRLGILGGACDVDVCAEHGTWFDRTELDSFVRAHSEARAGEITDDDLTAAGVGKSSSATDDLVGGLGVIFSAVGLLR